MGRVAHQHKQRQHRQVVVQGGIGHGLPTWLYAAAHSMIKTEGDRADQPNRVLFAGTRYRQRTG